MRKHMTMITSIIAAGLLCSGCNIHDAMRDSLFNVSMDGEPAIEQEYTQNPEFKYKARSQTGAYLSSRVARLSNDWEAASYYFDTVVDKDFEDSSVRYQAMIMAMNAGRYDESILHAEFLLDQTDVNALSNVIAAMGAVREGDFEAAEAALGPMPDDALAQLIKGPMQAWVYVFLDKPEMLEALDFTKSFVLYQAVIAADAANKHELVASLAQKPANLAELPPALQQHLSAIFKRRDVSYKTALITADETVKPREVLDIREGIAWVYYDLAMPLYLQYQNETGRLLFHMALALVPDHTEARIRIAEYAAMSGRTEEAIQALQNVSPESESYELVQKLIAELMVDNGEVGQALDILKTMAKERNDISLYVQIGGIYAANNKLSGALKAYNRALEIAAESNERAYWQVFFARGRIYDAMGNWDNAEEDLLTALKYQPEQAVILNYLGYSWADRGVNLDKALEMIEQAVKLEPNDGAIRDSLGWVYFRLGYYKKATEHLERAATLMPYDPVVNSHLGDAYWKVGRRAEAEFQWKRALNNNEDDDILTTELEEKLSRY
jgi:tetratricopeptide (TPR) repeat protein